MAVWVFEEIKESKRVTAQCTVCGKRRTRTFSVMQTVNRFNKNQDGTVKTEDQIEAENIRELNRICAEPFVCAGCSGD